LLEHSASVSQTPPPTLRVVAVLMRYFTVLTDYSSAIYLHDFHIATPLPQRSKASPRTSAAVGPRWGPRCNRIWAASGGVSCGATSFHTVLAVSLVPGRPSTHQPHA